MHCNNRVEMIRHDDEILDFELVFGDQGSEDVDQEAGVSFGLEKVATHARLCCYEENTGRIKDVFGR